MDTASKYHKLGRNTQIKKQVLEVVSMAIKEHRWKDVMTILPSLVAVASYMIPPYFIWRVLFITMANRKISMDIQMQILFVMMKTVPRDFEIALEFLANNFSTCNEEQLQVIAQAGQGAVACKTPDQHQMFVCFKAYVALIEYVHWRKYNDNSVLKSEIPEEENLQKLEKIKFGENVWNNLKKILERAQNASLMKNSEFDWVLCPLVDVEENLKNNESQAARRPFQDTEGLQFIKSYMESRLDHLPSLLTYFQYLKGYHPEEENLRENVLQNIITLSPESSLVLDHTKLVVKKMKKTRKQFKERLKESYTTEDCMLKYTDVDELFRCLKNLCYFIEFEMWNTNTVAWNLLVNFYIFSTKAGYKEKTAKQCLRCLKNLGCREKAEDLVILMRKNGKYSKDFLRYLSDLRNSGIFDNHVPKTFEAEICQYENSCQSSWKEANYEELENTLYLGKINQSTRPLSSDRGTFSKRERENDLSPSGNNVKKKRKLM